MTDDLPAKPKRHAPKGRLKARAASDPLEPIDPMEGVCTATSKRSRCRCRKLAIPGGTVCRMHGGAAPQVKAKAMDRLLALQMPAIARLAELVAQKEYPSTAMAAVKDVLDRTMGKPMESVRLSGDDEAPVVIKWQISE